MRFKRVLKAATKAGYFRINPSGDVKAKAHPSAKKEILIATEYKKLMVAYLAKQNSQWLWSVFEHLPEYSFNLCQ